MSSANLRFKLLSEDILRQGLKRKDWEAICTHTVAVITVRRRQSLFMTVRIDKTDLRTWWPAINTWFIGQELGCQG